MQALNFLQPAIGTSASFATDSINARDCTSRWLIA